MEPKNASLQELIGREYQYGFKTEIEPGMTVKGLTEDTIRFISAHKGEPAFMLEFRMNAFHQWQKMTEPRWADLEYPPIDYQNIIYYCEPKQQTQKPQSLEEIDPELRRTFEKLGIPLMEQKRLAGVAVDAIFDSVSVATTFKGKLKEAGVIFCPFSEALREYQKALEVTRNSSLAHFRIAQVFFLQGNNQSAANEFRQVFSGDLEPKWTEVWAHIYLGNIFDITDQRDRALNEYRQALRTKDNTQGALEEAGKYVNEKYVRPRNTQ